VEVLPRRRAEILLPVVDVSLKVERGTDSVDVVVSVVARSELADSRRASSGSEGEGADVSERSTIRVKEVC
jgi:hypothetical protein